MMSNEKKELLKIYNKGLESYKLRHWDQAIDYFSQALKIIPDDGPSKLYLERATDCKKTPPPDDWDGVFVMKTK
jgi:adenylate cyclase